MKHLMASSFNMSARQATKFGMSNLKKRAEKVVSAAEKISAIKNKHLYFAKVEQKVYLQSIGRTPDGFLTSSSSESECSDEEDEEMIPNEVNNERPLDTAQTCLEEPSTINQPSVNELGHESPTSQFRNDMPSTGSGRKEKDLPCLDVNSVVVLDILREVEWNWLAFVVLLESRFEKEGYSQEVFDQFLVDFASQLPNPGLSNDEFQLAEQSRAAYLSEVAQKEVRIHEIIEEVNSDDENDYGGAGGGCDESPDESEILRKLKLIKDRGKRLAKSEIELKGLNGRRKSQKTESSVLARHPDIGEVMENIVREADVGADKWRRTGVYTFTGDTKKEKRMTFKKLREKICQHYGEKISHGTLLQLCVNRDKRRMSSKRYKRVANIKYQRTRKGFNLKFNPDAKWSRSLYKSLDKLQIDGKHIVLLNRDDQAGFWLDSTFTHKNMPSLNVDGPTVTTRTDFLNKHYTQLQTTSYNFTKTKTTSEVCIGVVKASGVHQKNPSQHAADLDMLQAMDHPKTVFLQEDSGEVKEIKCVRVDGASDEGPSHTEVQFLWTERHMNRPTKVTLVTTRSSGDSFLDRVELQNGCLSHAHSNLFIPSTLCGEPCDEEGQFSEEKYRANMEAALKQYIERVDDSPCMWTTIKLQRGATDHPFLERRSRLLVFLKGSVKQKAELRKQDHEEYEYFEKVWKVRQNHLDHNLPINYIFLLRCCEREGCPHPLCERSARQREIPVRTNQATVRDASNGIFCICRQPEGDKFMICCDQCGEWFHCDCIGITEEEGNKMADDDVSFVCQQCRKLVDDNSQTEILPKWYPDGPYFDFFPYPVDNVTRPATANAPAIM